MILAVLGAVLVGAVVLGFQFAPHGGPAPGAVVASKDPNAAFFKQKAQECQGNMSKLSPQDQQEVIQKAGGPQYAHAVMQSYWDGTNK